MAKIEKIGNIQIVDNKEDKFFYFPMISMACTGSRYLIRIRHLRGFHSWVPFSFSAPVCASVKYNVTWFYKFYRVSLSRKIYKVLFISLLYIQSNTFICQSDVFIHRTFTYG